MTGMPEDALARARERAQKARSAGQYAEPEALATLVRGEGTELARLDDWAFIEVDPAGVRSTRRLGAPITLLKRALLRLLRQHHDELASQQTRFNVHLLEQVARLERRVRALEKRAKGGPP